MTPSLSLASSVVNATVSLISWFSSQKQDQCGKARALGTSSNWEVNPSAFRWNVGLPGISEKLTSQSAVGGTCSMSTSQIIGTRAWLCKSQFRFTTRKYLGLSNVTLQRLEPFCQNYFFTCVQCSRSGHTKQYTILSISGEALQSPNASQRHPMKYSQYTQYTQVAVSHVPGQTIGHLMLQCIQES